MVQRVRPAVVRITAGNGVGTGFIFQLDGDAAYVMTNHHVIAGYSVPTVRVRDSTDYNGAVIGSDSIRDIAVIRICCGNFKSVPFAEASEVVVGDEIVNIGYALALRGQATVSTGIISAVRYDSHRSTDVIQTDASINPGNSGGPMLTLDGRVLGINTFKYVGTNVEGVGFALSGPYVKRLIPGFMSAARATATPGAATEVAPAPDDYRIIHGPLAGSLKLHRYLTIYEMAEKHHQGDIGMEATFRNPVGATYWYYGFIFASETGSAVLVEVSHSGAWFVTRWIKDRGHKVEDVKLIPAGALKTGANARNHVKMIVEGDALTLYINGERMSRDADLSPFELGAGGDFGIFTWGTYPRGTAEEDGPLVWYEHWQVWEP